MTIRVDALCTLDQLELAIGVDTIELAKREQVIDAVTEAILDWTGRAIIHNPGLGTVTTEFHDGEVDWDSIFTREFPISSVTSLHDDVDRVYGASTLLTENTHFLVYDDEGRIQLIDSSGISILTKREQGFFNPGFKNIKLVYVAGYTNNAAIPPSLRQGCIEWCAFVLNYQASAGLIEDSISLCKKTFANVTSMGPPKHVQTLLNAHRSVMLGLV